MAESTQTPAGWTGQVENCVVGTESQESVAVTLRAVNTLRDFAGIGPVTFDPSLNQKALAAALMMRAAGALSHSPGPDWPCFSNEGAAAAGKSNLYLGQSGAGAMIGYVHDVGVASLGHRRWVLNPRQTTFGTGSTGTSNALYVIGASTPSPMIPEVVAWPPSGHVPWPLIIGSWSAALNVQGTIDASAARVQVLIDGRITPVSDVTDMGAGGYGDGHLIKWNVALADGDRDGDRSVDVIIDDVKVDGTPRQFRHSIQTIRADPPAATTYTASRTTNTVTVRWEAASERGVPVSGYRIQGFDGDQFILDHTVGATVREVTLPYASAQTLFVRVTPLSRAGSPPLGPYVSAPPPPPPPPPPPSPPPVRPGLPPVVQTGAASAVVSTGAMIAGTVNPRLSRTSYLFEYGRTTGYGSATTAKILPSDQGDPVTVSAGIARLAPSTGYHYRLVATSASGTTRGADATFTTTAAGNGATTGGGVGSGTDGGVRDDTDRTGPTMRIYSTSLRMAADGRFKVRIACPLIETLGCRGTLVARSAAKIATTRAGRSAKVTLALGSTRFTIGGGQRRTLTLRAAGRARSVVRLRRRITVRLSIAASDATGNKRSLVQRLTLRTTGRPRTRTTE